MTVNTTADTQLSPELVFNYFKNLVNQFFKILPMKESQEDTLPVYIDSLRSELLGCGNLIIGLASDPHYLTLLSIIQYLRDNPDCSVKTTKREVFKAISICNRFKARYTEGGAE